MTMNWSLEHLQIRISAQFSKHVKLAETQNTFHVHSFTIHQCNLIYTIPLSHDCPAGLDGGRHAYYLSVSSRSLLYMDAQVLSLKFIKFPAENQPNILWNLSSPHKWIWLGMLSLTYLPYLLLYIVTELEYYKLEEMKFDFFESERITGCWEIWYPSYILRTTRSNSKAQTSMNNKALVLFTHKEKILAPNVDKFWLGLTPQVKDTSSGTPNECWYISPDLVEE